MAQTGARERCECLEGSSAARSSTQAEPDRPRTVANPPVTRRRGVWLLGRSVDQQASRGRYPTRVQGELPSRPCRAPVTGGGLESPEADATRHAAGRSRDYLVDRGTLAGT